MHTCAALVDVWLNGRYIGCSTPVGQWVPSVWLQRLFVFLMQRGLKAASIILECVVIIIRRALPWPVAALKIYALRAS